MPLGRTYVRLVHPRPITFGHRHHQLESGCFQPNHQDEGACGTLSLAPLYYDLRSCRELDRVLHSAEAQQPLERTSSLREVEGSEDHD